jgi:hypothetical protein
LSERRKTSRHDSTPTTKARWFDDHDVLDDVEANELKPATVPPVPETALSVQSFFERLPGEDPPRS